MLYLDRPVLRPICMLSAGICSREEPSEAEVEDLAEEVRQPTKAAEKITARLRKQCPEFEKLVQASTWFLRRRSG